MTGTEFDKLFDRITDAAYSDFLDPTKKRSLYKQGLFSLIEDKYRVLDEQRRYDELSKFITVDKTISITANRFAIAPIPITNIVVAGLVITVTTQLDHNVVVGTQVTISGVLGLTGINGTYTVSALSGTTGFAFVIGVAPGGAYTPLSGNVTYPNMVSDYMHLLFLKAKYRKSTTNLTMIDATNTQPISVEYSRNNQLRTGSLIYNQQVFGNTAANGTYYLRQVSSRKYDLFNDKNFTSPVSGNGTYSGGGTTVEIVYKKSQQIASDSKGDILAKGTIYSPKHQFGLKKIYLYPEDEVCTEVTFDYVNTNVILIDPTDTTYDLELTYTTAFLNELGNTCKKIFAEGFLFPEYVQYAAGEEAKEK